MDQFDIETFLAMPRMSGLTLSPDGTRLVLSVTTPAPDRQRFRSALWALDPDGTQEPRQLTRSAKGESTARFATDGTLLFTSPRPDPDAAEPDAEPPPALWALPPDGGEATLLSAPAAGVAGVVPARDAPAVLVLTELFAASEDLAADKERAEARKEAGVAAQLYDRYPIRSWDRWLGPREPALLHGHLPAPTGARLEPETLARGPGLLNLSAPALSPDGSMVVTAVLRDVGDVRERVADLVAIDVVSGEQRTLLADGAWYDTPAISPDGSRVAVLREDLGHPDHPADIDLVVLDLASGSHRVVAPGLDLWPGAPTWLPDGDAIVFTCDEQGHRPVYRVDLGPSGSEDRVTRLTGDGAFSDLCVAPDGSRVYALHAGIGFPPYPVVMDAADPQQTPRPVPSPAAPATGAGHVEHVSAPADDGVEIRSWLVLPPGASADQPAPLVVFIHGGPLGSWNTWHWRWNPHILAAQGYAVLCPDPALSTGYGQDFLARGWGAWGERPFTDVMAAVDGAVARPDIDAERTAAMGGSFGGYMANWVAGQTDRFQAIVTHASLWDLEPFHGTTDFGAFWERQFGDPYRDPSRYRTHSPRQHVGRIKTPMLVIHGEQDLRVPISEALTLWTDLMLHEVDAKFLYFPDENHWVLKPQNARLWYETVLAFLDHHVRQQEWERPELL